MKKVREALITKFTSLRSSIESYSTQFPRRFAFILGALLFLAIAFLAMERHYKRDVFYYRGELWADKGGYYIYLPALFIYDFDASRFPKDIEKAMGKGFRFDNPPGKLYTRYTCGVAILEAPFFLIAHALAGPLDFEPNGFSPIYHKVINLASAFYTTLALILLFGFLRYYFDRKTAFLTLSLLFWGTNLFFYSVDETGMSHIYSFFLFSVVMHYFRKYIHAEQPERWQLWLVAGASAMAVLIRPTNVVFLIAIWFFLRVGSRKEMIDRLKLTFQPLTLAAFSVCTFVAFLPQFLYWKYLSGDFIYYSYEHAGFDFWKSPKFLEVWFETLNGLFTFTPMAAFFLMGMIIMMRRKISLGWASLAVFFVMSYSFASWEFWHFGCSFGQRSFVEFYALFSLPFAWFVHSCFLNTSGFSRSLVGGLLALFVYLNLKFSYFWKECWHWGHWDWAKYFDIIGGFFGL